MNKTERQTEFALLFDAIPGRNIDKIRRICKILMYKENTVRIFCIDPDRPSGGKAMPEAKLRILRRELEREGVVMPTGNTTEATQAA